MGCGKSKNAADPEHVAEQTNNPANIHYDNDGNLKHGGNLHDRDDEMHRVLSSDDAVEEEGKEWYLIEEPWAQSWLEFVSLGKEVSPAPGPIKNMRLLAANYDKKWFEAKSNLVMSKGRVVGHYRRIPKEMWELYLDFYPDSGPEIRMTFREVL
jgi:hypothetical protein